MSDLEPIAAEPDEEAPMWDSDIEDREARKRKMIVFGGSAVAVLVGFVGLYAALSLVAGGLTSDPEPSPERGSNDLVTEGGVDLPAPPPLIDVNPITSAGDLDWYAIDSPIGFSTRLLASDTGSFYALSTIPGNAAVWPIPKAIYKSGDGENWEIISLDDTQSAHDMALAGDTIYLIGTAPATQNFQDAPEVLISASSDNGDNWTQTLLPTNSGPPDGVPVQWANVSMRVGANRDAVVALVQSQYFLDYSRLVPSEFANPNFGFEAGADGVAVIDHRALEELYMSCEGEDAAGIDIEEMSPECQALFNGDDSAGAIGFVTWEEMGLADGGQPVFSELFVSAGGGEFESIDSPFDPGSEVYSFHATATGFMGIESGRDSERIWWSQDGRTWQEDEQLNDFDWIVNVGSTGGRTVVIGQSRNSPMAAWSNDDGSWEFVDFNDVLPVADVAGAGGEGGRWLTSAAAGPLGVAAVFQSFDELAGIETAEVVVGSSPEDWSLVRIDEITGMAGGYSDWVAVGTDEVIIRYEVFTQFQPRSLQVIGTRTAA